jgi:membrane protein implicated in regulation of membrane protease activity
MQWWAWVVAGAILLGSELAFVDAQFYLVFVGGAALVVGLSQLAGAGLAMGPQWLMFAALAAISMVSFRRRIYERMRRGLPEMPGGPVGESVVLPADLAPGAGCRLEFRGSSWSAVNGGRLLIAAGAKARIRRVDGLTLIVHAGD